VQTSERANLPRWRGQAGFFEIWFFVVFVPSAGRAFWVRFTTDAPAPGGSEPSRAIVWAAAFDAHRGEKAVARKAVRDIESYDRGPKDRLKIRIDGAELSNGHTKGAVASDGRSLSWDLHFETAPQEVRRSPWLVHALHLPTRSRHANDGVRFSGTFVVDGETLSFDDGIGVQMHLYGERRLDDLRWVYCGAFEEDASARMEIIAGRFQRTALGMRTPLATSVWLETSTRGIDRRGFPQALGATLREPLPHVVEVRSRGPLESVLVRAYCDPASMVGYIYRDPAGHDVYIAHSDIASAVVENLRRPTPLAAWRVEERLTSRHTTALEFHGLEPFPDVRYIPWEAES
jgi:hypothetical protein